MKGLLISIVDVLGIFVPGFLLLTGIFFFPPLVNDLFDQWPTWTTLSEAIRVNFSTIGILFAISAYVLGFIIRQCSVFTLNLLTFPWWAKQLEKRVEGLEKTLETALNNESLCESLRAEARLRSKYEIAYIAPYFPFAKRLIQNGNPSLWAGAQRYEAELRFSAGIFIPLLIFTCDGLLLKSLAGYILAMISGIGAFVVLATFPTRRIREVIYNYYMALIVLQYSTTSVNKTQPDDL